MDDEATVVAPPMASLAAVDADEIPLNEDIDLQPASSYPPAGAVSAAPPIPPPAAAPAVMAGGFKPRPPAAFPPPVRPAPDEPPDDTAEKTRADTLAERSEPAALEDRSMSRETTSPFSEPPFPSDHSVEAAGEEPSKPSTRPPAAPPPAIETQARESPSMEKGAASAGSSSAQSSGPPPAARSDSAPRAASARPALTRSARPATAGPARTASSRTASPGLSRSDTRAPVSARPEKRGDDAVPDASARPAPVSASASAATTSGPATTKTPSRAAESAGGAADDAWLKTPTNRPPDHDAIDPSKPDALTSALAQHQAAERKKRLAAAKQAGPDLPPKSGPLKQILLIEDSKTMQLVVRRTFGAEPYHVTTVESGEMAVDLAMTLQPDVIIVDYTLEGADGFSVCEKIKAVPNLSDVPTILMHGPQVELDASKTKEVGVLKTLAKPFESSALIDAVRELAPPPQ